VHDVRDPVGEAAFVQSCTNRVVVAGVKSLALITTLQPGGQREGESSGLAINNGKFHGVMTATDDTDRLADDHCEVFGGPRPLCAFDCRAC
jgi:hypothetical protein